LLLLLHRAGDLDPLADVTLQLLLFVAGEAIDVAKITYRSCGSRRLGLRRGLRLRRGIGRRSRRLGERQHELVVHADVAGNRGAFEHRRFLLHAPGEGHRWRLRDHDRAAERERRCQHRRASDIHELPPHALNREPAGWVQSTHRDRGPPQLRRRSHHRCTSAYAAAITAMTKASTTIWRCAVASATSHAGPTDPPSVIKVSDQIAAPL